ncbi:MAG: Holliday junction resolvase RuvX [Synergistaceae bacterium]|nr:Holliday junction resolvase RuvX [Synergistaceae bacterium]
MNNSGRVLALDIGAVRIGAAVSDPSRIIAQGLGVWNAENGEWLNDLDECIRQYDPSLIVLGLPVRTDGKKSEAAERVLSVLEELKEKYPEKNFATHDERFTTVIAQRVLLQADTSRKKRKKTVDKIAAVIILEDVLEKLKISGDI